MAKVKFTFNGIELEGEEGIPVLLAVTRAGYEIPNYCYFEPLGVAGECRLCACEYGEPDKSGQLKMHPKLVMSCQTPVKAGCVVRTDTDNVKTHQRAVMDFHLANHPLDCPVCDQAGECYLQDYSYRYGPSYSRFNEDKIKQSKKDVGPNVVLYADRCILCTRCVRFTRDISGGGELAVWDRGAFSEIDVYPGKLVADKLAGNVVDICPVGALLDKQFLFKQRVWDLKPTPSICPRCATGCGIWVDHNSGVVWRLRPRHNPQVNDYWMCDEGRYGYKFAQAQERLLFCRMRQGTIPFSMDTDEIVSGIRQAIEPHRAGRVAGVLSPAASCETQWLLAKYLREANPKATLVRGPVFREGSDQVFKSGFRISAEKVPNRRGAEAILKQLGGSQMDFAQLAAQAGQLDLLWIQGHYPWQDWCPPELAAKFRQARCLVVEDILPGKLADTADVVLAGAAWTEMPGSFINDQGLRQHYERGPGRPASAQDDLEILWKLARPGVCSMETIETELKPIFTTKTPRHQEEKSNIKDQKLK